jgi:hypothetical protein
MNLESLIQGSLGFVSAHPYTTGAILAVVGVLAYIKVKLFVKAITACLILGAIVYIGLFIVNLTSTGMKNTEKLLSHPNQDGDKIQR